MILLAWVLFAIPTGRVVKEKLSFEDFCHYKYMEPAGLHRQL